MRPVNAITAGLLLLNVIVEAYRASTYAALACTGLCAHLHVRVPAYLPPPHYSSRVLFCISGARTAARDEAGLIALYELPRAECLRHKFTPTVDAGLGDLIATPASAMCASGVGLTAPPARSASSAISSGTIAQLLPRLRAARAFSVELWLRPSSAAGRDIADTEDALQPIFALGQNTSLHAARGCHDRQYALLIGQEGSLLRVDVGAAVDVRRRATHVCLQAEVDSALASGAVLRDAAKLYHIVVSVAAHAPLTVHVNGIRMPGLFLAANPLAPADQPLDVQFDQWDSALHALVAPVLDLPSHQPSPAAEGPWDGSIHLLALYAHASPGGAFASSRNRHVLALRPCTDPCRPLEHAGAHHASTELIPCTPTTPPDHRRYARALDEGQIAANYAAFVRDSAPRASPTVANGTEDAPMVVTLSGSDPFDAAFAPDPTLPLQVYVASLPTNGTLHVPRTRGAPPSCAGGWPAGACRAENALLRARRLEWWRHDGDGGGAGCGGGCPYTTAAVTADELPLLLPDGWVWFEPPADAFSIAPDAPAASFRYFVSDGTQRSELGVASMVLAPVNDAPVGVPITLDVYAGVPAPFTLAAIDIDSRLGAAQLTTVPRHGMLYALPEASASTSAAAAAAAGPPLKSGAVLAAGRWQLVYLHTPGSVLQVWAEGGGGNGGSPPASPRPPAADAAGSASSSSAGSSARDVLLRDGFTYRVCDLQRACAAEDTPVDIVVHNALRAAAGSTTTVEEAPTVVTLDGIDERGSSLHYVVSSLPQVGTLYACVPPSAPSRGACCMEPGCLRTPIAVDAPLTAGSGALVYVPPRDYFNCVPHGRHGCGAGKDAATRTMGSDTFRFYVVDTFGRRSANAEHVVWVAGVNDAPRWVGAHEMIAVALARTRLPDLRLDEPDRDTSEWEVQLHALRGFVSLPQSTLSQLQFTLGDGTSDRLVRLSGSPSAVVASLRGASYRALDEGHNDTISIRIADPRGASLAPVGQIFVHVVPSASSLDPYAEASIGTAAMWLVLAAGFCLCCVQLLGCIRRACTYPRADELERYYRYLKEQEEREREVATEGAERAAGAAAVFEPCKSLPPTTASARRPPRANGALPPPQKRARGYACLDGEEENGCTNGSQPPAAAPTLSSVTPFSLNGATNGGGACSARTGFGGAALGAGCVPVSIPPLPLRTHCSPPLDGTCGSARLPAAGMPADAPAGTADVGSTSAPASARGPGSARGLTAVFRGQFGRAASQRASPRSSPRSSESTPRDVAASSARARLSAKDAGPAPAPAPAL